MKPAARCSYQGCVTTTTASPLAEAVRRALKNLSRRVSQPVQRRVLLVERVEGRGSASIRQPAPPSKISKKRSEREFIPVLNGSLGERKRLIQLTCELREGFPQITHCTANKLKPRDMLNTRARSRLSVAKNSSVVTTLQSLVCNKCCHPHLTSSGIFYFSPDSPERSGVNGFFICFPVFIASLCCDP